MEVICPNCGASGQLAGKFCDICGYSIPVDGAQASSVGQSNPGSTMPVDPASLGAGLPLQPDTTLGAVPQAGVQPSGGGGQAQLAGAQFGVVRDGQASLSEGFTLTRVGNFLVGRMDQETGHQVDVDLRQWVQPIEGGGQKQYLVHRKQCYVSVGSGGVVTLQACPGAEADTLVKAAGESTFTSFQNLEERRTKAADGSFELNLHDQIFMGDPEAVMYYLSGDPTAQTNYVVVELINKS